MVLISAICTIIVISTILSVRMGVKNLKQKEEKIEKLLIQENEQQRNSIALDEGLCNTQAKNIVNKSECDNKQIKHTINKINVCIKNEQN